MKSLRRMGSFIRPYRGLVLLLLFTVLLPVVMELTVPRLLQYVVDQGIRRADMDAILRGTLMMLSAALVSAVATLGQGVFRAWLSQGLAYDMRQALFAHIQTFSFGNLDHTHTGQLMTRLSSDVDVVRMFMSGSLALILRAVAMIAGSAVMLTRIDWQLSLVMWVLLPIAGLLIWSVMRVVRPLFTLVQQRLGALNTIVQENLAGARVVKAFVREASENARFGEVNRAFMEQNIEVGRMMAVTMPLLAVLTNIGIVAIIGLGGRDAIDGRLTIGELIAFNSYLMIGMAPLLLLGNMLTAVSRAEAAILNLAEI